MERKEAIFYAVNTMKLDAKKVSKYATVQLLKKVSSYKASNPAIVAVINKQLAPKVEKNNKGRYMVGWENVDGAPRILKYCVINRGGNVCQTVVDAALEPEKAKRVHIYKKLNTALKQIKLMQEIDSEKYDGLTVLYV